jgi:hypothetical protein
LAVELRSAPVGAQTLPWAWSGHSHPARAKTRDEPSRVRGHSRVPEFSEARLRSSGVRIFSFPTGLQGFLGVRFLGYWGIAAGTLTCYSEFVRHAVSSRRPAWQRAFRIYV